MSEKTEDFTESTLEDPVTPLTPASSIKTLRETNLKTIARSSFSRILQVVSQLDTDLKQLITSYQHLFLSTERTASFEEILFITT